MEGAPWAQDPNCSRIAARHFHMRTRRRSGGFLGHGLVARATFTPLQQPEPPIGCDIDDVPKDNPPETSGFEAAGAVGGARENRADSAGCAGGSVIAVAERTVYRIDAGADE